MPSDQELQKAKSEGASAYFRYEELKSNPYHPTDEKELYLAWYHGWMEERDMHSFTMDDTL